MRLLSMFHFSIHTSHVITLVWCLNRTRFVWFFVNSDVILTSSHIRRVSYLARYFVGQVGGPILVLNGEGEKSSGPVNNVVFLEQTSPSYAPEVFKKKYELKYTAVLFKCNVILEIIVFATSISAFAWCRVDIYLGRGVLCHVCGCLP